LENFDLVFYDYSNGFKFGNDNVHSSIAFTKKIDLQLGCPNFWNRKIGSFFVVFYLVLVRPFHFELFAYSKKKQILRAIQNLSISTWQAFYNLFYSKCMGICYLWYFLYTLSAYLTNVILETLLFFTRIDYSFMEYLKALSVWIARNYLANEIIRLSA
jgi:hypothetical protein